MERLETEAKAKGEDEKELRRRTAGELVLSSKGEERRGEERRGDGVVFNTSGWLC